MDRDVSGNGGQDVCSENIFLGHTDDEKARSTDVDYPHLLGQIIFRIITGLI